MMALQRNRISFVLLVLVPFATSSELVAILGTENGYDQGGPDPVCWESRFEYTETTPNSTDANTLNTALWDTLQQRSGETIDLLDRCDPSTSLSVAALEYRTENTMYSNCIYDFKIKLSSMVPSTAAKAFVRLQFCDALHYGFCNPIPQIMVDADDDVKFTMDERILVTKWMMVDIEDPSPADLSIQIPEWIPKGVYHVIAHAFVVFDDDDSTLLSRLDIALPIEEGGIINVLDPPILQEVTKSIKIVVGVATGICAAYALGLVIFLIVHRNHAVMRLAQGSFLVAISIGCFIQIVCSFVLLPTKGVYCRLVGVLCLIPMTFVASCMVGRIWRVYQTLSNANKFGRKQTSKRSFVNTTGDSVVCALTSIANFTSLSQRTRGRNSVLSRQSSVRQSISAKQTAGLVLFLTMPQVVLQVLTASMTDRGLVLITDVTGGFQKRICEQRFMWVPMVGTGYVVFVCILAVGLAWIARDLPSAFCEKDQVYRAASVSILTTFVGISLSGMLQKPTTPPNLTVILQGTWSLVVPMSVLVLIVYPKVQRVLSGEKVVMSNMVGGRFSIHQPMQEASWQPGNGQNKTSGDTTTSGSDTVRKPPHISTESRKVSLQADDPLPTQVEGLLFDVQSVLRCVTQKIMQGRAPSRVDLVRLGEEVGLLSDELSLIDFVNNLQSQDNIRPPDAA